MSELRTITKTGAEQQDVIQLLDQLTGEIFIPYSAFSIIISTPVVAAIGGSTVGGYAMDATTAEAVTTVLRVPNDFPALDATAAVNCYVNWSAAATSGDVVWDIDYRVSALAEDIGAAVTNITATDTAAGTADFASESPVLAIAANVLADSDLLFITVRREAADAGDTMTGDASFNGLRISYTTNPKIV